MTYTEVYIPAMEAIRLDAPRLEVWNGSLHDVFVAVRIPDSVAAKDWSKVDLRGL